MAIFKMYANSFWHAAGRQLRRPSGIAGRLAGALMEIANAEPNHLAIAALRIEPGDTVLELGFGPGRAIAAMARQAVDGRVFGVDRSRVMLVQACRRNRRAILAGRVELYLADFTRLPFPDGSIDRILAVNVIYFWHDPAAVLREMRRVLRPGGRVSVYATDAESMRRWKFATPQTHRLDGITELSAVLRAEEFQPARICIRLVRIRGGVRGLLATLTTGGDLGQTRL